METCDIHDIHLADNMNGNIQIYCPALGYGAMLSYASIDTEDCFQKCRILFAHTYTQLHC